MSTFSVVEMLPGGHERVLARGLTLAQMQTYVPRTAWSVTYRQESP